MPRAALLAAAALLVPMLLATPVAPASGVYFGAGPSERSSGSGTCEEMTTLTLYPSATHVGSWAAEVACVFVWPFNTYSGVGYSGMPSHVMDDLRGSPETGFSDSGSANVHGTSQGTLDWAITIGPLGDATEWRIDFVFYPAFGSTEPRTSWWRGTADFDGAHV